MAPSESDEKMAAKGSSADHSRLVNAVLAELGCRGDCRLWKNHTGTAIALGSRGGPRQFIKFGLKGSADILGITCDGKFLAIECKTGNARQSKQQLAFMKMIVTMGGRYWLVKNASEALEKIDALELKPVDFKLI